MSRQMRKTQLWFAQRCGVANASIGRREFETFGTLTRPTPFSLHLGLTRISCVGLGPSTAPTGVQLRSPLGKANARGADIVTGRGDTQMVGVARAHALTTPNAVPRSSMHCASHALLCRRRARNLVTRLMRTQVLARLHAHTYVRPPLCLCRLPVQPSCVPISTTRLQHSRLTRSM